jgi:hypothetical protein
MLLTRKQPWLAKQAVWHDREPCLARQAARRDRIAPRRRYKQSSFPPDRMQEVLIHT